MLDNKIIQQVINKLSPHENAEYTVRDISLLSCSIFGDCYFKHLRNIFNANNFSITFWYVRKDSNVVFYRSGKENEDFSKKLAQEFLQNIDYAKKTAEKLIALTDKINNFLEENSTVDKLINNWSDFIELYFTFFAYHQVAYWPAEYLIKQKEQLDKQETINQIIGLFDKAYKYNENVVPRIEKLIRDLNLNNYTYQEISEHGINRLPEHQGSSLLFLDQEIYTLTFDEGKALHEAIQEDYNKHLNNKKVQGLIANKGIIKGKVRLILDLAKLNECQAGDVLVTTMTRPQYNNIIKNVAAIITDEGGLLCHASILAREFNIPCIVGTKNATKILNDGDMILVDANQGIVEYL